MKKDALIVEDDLMIRQLVRVYLEREGYNVAEAVDGEAAKELFLRVSPCVLVLDLMLPKISGEALCRWVRNEQRSDAIIIMLSAKVRHEDRVAGLRMGADDYVPKPFSPEELVARIDAVLRRGGQACQRLSYHGITIKPRKREVWRNGNMLDLTKFEFDMLYYLMQHPNEPVSRSQLLEQIHPFDEKEVLERTVDVHIKKLRAKVEDNPMNPQRIQTVRGVGYAFMVENSEKMGE